MKTCFMQCVVPENIHTPIRGSLEIPSGRGGGVLKAKIFKGKYDLNWDFQRGGGFKLKKPCVGVVWIFSGTTQSSQIICIHDQLCFEHSAKVSVYCLKSFGLGFNFRTLIFKQGTFYTPVSGCFTILHPIISGMPLTANH